MRLWLFSVSLCLCGTLAAQRWQPIEQQFTKPDSSHAPWVFWYWLQGAVSREGITADLEAMKRGGIAGAYLMPIKDTLEKPLYTPQVRQLTPEWFNMVHFAMQECKRLGLQLSMHVSDGFALAGGPWISPDQSMQQLTWSIAQVRGNDPMEIRLAQPLTQEGYYKDIEVLAFPALPGAGLSSLSRNVQVTSNAEDQQPAYLNDSLSSKSFASSTDCWVQYAFDQPFTTRSIEIRTKNNYQANRLIVQVSDDGIHFRTHVRLQPPRHGWQDWDQNYTHLIPQVTARYYRFVYAKEGTEPGSEDLDAAKWKASLKLSAIILHTEAFINQFQSKNGSVWRISERSSLPSSSCIRSSDIINISQYMDAAGTLRWQRPPGDWTIIRIGHTSTGHRNETAGGGKGLECDKFNPAIVWYQFQQWYGNIYDRFPVARDVLTGFHVDSWECGSQNWSSVFRDEFIERRGYDPLPWLPAVAGYAIGSASASEGFLYDLRLTIAELIDHNFYGTLKQLAAAKGVKFTAESVAPTMVSDGMLHYKNVDVPMGEFWLRSPTHDKPNDMLDAISAAHIYGKNEVRSESFTELRMDWDEHPGMMKALLDRNFALGINSITYHVFMHNPYMNRAPGVTLDAIGTFFQRDQTWWPLVNGFTEYTNRCSMMLSQGRPVADLAVFTGDELPRRSVLPERLMTVLPGVIPFGLARKEAMRLRNEGTPTRQLPAGVSGSANIPDPASYLDMLQGFQYDSFNPDAFNEVDRVENGRIILHGGAAYAALVIPGRSLMNPSNVMSHATLKHLLDLARSGATLLWQERPFISPGMELNDADHAALSDALDSIFSDAGTATQVHEFGRGRIYTGLQDLHRLAAALRVQPDVTELVHPVDSLSGLAWSHRRGEDFDLYFLSNQRGRDSHFEIRFRERGAVTEVWDAVTGRRYAAPVSADGVFGLDLDKDASVFVVMKAAPSAGLEPERYHADQGVSPRRVLELGSFKDLSKDSLTRYFSGVYTYKFEFEYNGGADARVMLQMDELHELARVRVNGDTVGVIWTGKPAIRVERLLRPGKNVIEIEVANTWNNRLIGDHNNPVVCNCPTWTNAPYRLEGKPLLPAGIVGQVRLLIE